MCFTQRPQQPQVGVLKTVTGGPPAAFIRTAKAAGIVSNDWKKRFLFMDNPVDSV
jgi:hypothetical protein